MQTMPSKKKMKTISSSDANPPFRAVKLPRRYAFEVNSMHFEVNVPVWMDDNCTAREILIHDLEFISETLKAFKEHSYITEDGKEIPMQTFKLPPLKEIHPRMKHRKND